MIDSNPIGLGRNPRSRRARVKILLLRCQVLYVEIPKAEMIKPKQKPVTPTLVGELRRLMLPNAARGLSLSVSSAYHT